ncbi:MAG TPA: hypothetical protein VNI79_02955 [Sphingomicrobium sp.]|nr:hypothetical protein [Sphingomicrobium sp.]
MNLEAETKGGWRHLPLAFWLILLTGIGLRLVAFNAYSAHHPDEAMQYLEQAHRLVFGYGVVPWEFRYSIRSCLIPLALAGPMQIGEWLAPNTSLYLVLPRALIAGLNFSPVIAAWYLGARSSRRHAIVAMAVAAVWVECVLFSVQTLSESMAVACFLPAAVLLRRDAGTARIAAAGFLLALAGLLRFQFAPSIAVYALIIAGRDMRMWKGLLIGGLPVVAGGAAIDWAMGLSPYQWIAENYVQNIDAGRMRRIGGVAHWTYFFEMERWWGPAAPFILLTSLLAGKRYRPLLVAALVNILFHQFIGHKEWRYVWLSMQIAVVLSAIGSVNLVAMTLFGKRIRRPDGPATTVALILLWGSISLTLASSDAYRFHWRTNGEASRLAAFAGRDPRVCGLAGSRHRNVELGYAFVHRPIPVHLLNTKDAPSLSQPGATMLAFNALLVDPQVTRPPGFDNPIACEGQDTERLCLILRKGGCTSTPEAAAIEHQAMLERADM